MLTALNTALLAQRGDERFLTAVQVTFRPGRDGVDGLLGAAGHPAALVRRAGGEVEVIDGDKTVLGLFDVVEVSDKPFRLEAGDLLLLYTDGATEARPPRGAPGLARRLFGEDGLVAALAETAGLDSAATVAHLTGVLDVYSGGWADDDTALLAISVPPPDRRTVPSSPRVA